jgi:hypothetical protein
MSRQEVTTIHEGGFRPVMQRPITKVNLLSWSKAVSRRLQKEINTSLEKSIEQDGGFHNQGEQDLS